MAKVDPKNCDYLAVVSEWNSTTKKGGLVGNAYPIFNLTTGAVVAEPLEEFPNPGAVFLMSRTNLQTWDFAVLRITENGMYSDTDFRQCYFIPIRQPQPLINPSMADNIAVVLEHSSFDAGASVRSLTNPRHNVTPLFFVQKGQSFLGPLINDLTHLSSMDDVQKIDWRPAREDGMLYEFSREELALNGIKLSTYAHPDPSLNRILATPITLAYGPIRKATSPRPRDALPDANLIDWYLQRCPTAEIPSQLLRGLKAAFKTSATDDPAIQAARMLKVERELSTHIAFQEQRERFARQFVDTDAGQKMVRDLLAQTVAKRATEIQAEVDQQQGQLAAKRRELDEQLARAQDEHRRQKQALEDELLRLSREREKLEQATGQIKSTLSEDVGSLAAKMEAQIPLFAALAGLRPEAAHYQPSAPAGAVPTAKPVRLDFRPILPTAPLRPVLSEAKLVADLHGELGRAGLHFARDFVANIYVCFKAEPLNLIIGPPGYGKSMLVAALARGLGHSDALLRIAVRRSWSEDRYLLGFYDSFHGRYDPGTTGLVPQMIRAERDWKQDRAGAYVVLLDEFNLAAPEYYFSQLLQLLPIGDPVRELRLYEGGSAGDDSIPNRIALTPNLRFWGTINYDETTERLSPRTLDRTGMIFLGDADLKPTVDQDEHATMAGVSAGDLFGKFVREADACPEEHWALVSKVVDFLRSTDAGLGPRVELSPRVSAAIKRYLANSIDLLDVRKAVDFVVQQRILPVVRGRGEEFVVRIRRLQQLLSDENMPRSAAHVEEVLRRSEQQFGELDFLSY